MPRPLRIQLEKAVYFVTQEGPYQGRIFGDREDYEKYLHLLNPSKQTYGFKLFAYALLPNRIYLLIEAVGQKASLSRGMQQITLRYTQYFNHRYQRKGPLFSKRFRSVLVEKETHLAPLTRYIHLAPLRSGIVENLRAHPYTSYEAFTRIGTGQNSSFPNLNEEIQEVLGSVPGRPLGNPYEHYALSAGEEELKGLDQKLSRGFVLGSEEFMARARERLKEATSREAAPSPPPRNSLAVLTGVFAVTLGAIGLAIFTVARPLSGPVTVPSLKVEEMKLTGPADEIERLLTETANLDGTVWEVELISVSPEGVSTPIKDKIKFVGSSFESYYFASQGFSRSNYTVTVNNNNGVFTWETMQTNQKGEVVSWRGDWEGGKMEGMLSYHPVGQNPRDFSFFGRGGGLAKNA